jgi:lia operon protein LiaG
MSIKMRNFLIVLASVTAGSFLIAATIFFATGGIRPMSALSSEVSQSAEFDTENIDVIDISTVSTRVRVLPSSNEKIHVDFTGNITTSGSANNPRLEANVEKNILLIKIIYPPPFAIGLFNISELKLDIYIPQGYEKDIRVATTSGAIVLEDMTLENVKANSVSGKMDIASLSAKKISADNTSGRVALTDVEGDVEINTISGRVSADMSSLENEIIINSVSGAVDVRMPGDSGFSFQISSTSGTIENGFEATMTRSSNRNMQGTVGDGKGKISIHTISGKVMLGYHQ